jgi:hypothetical protein
MAEGEDDPNDLDELKALMKRNAESMAKLHAMIEELQRMLKKEMAGDSPGATTNGQDEPHEGSPIKPEGPTPSEPSAN